MKNFKFYIMMMFMLIFWKFSFSMTSSDSLGIDQYLGMAAKNNPGIKASFSQYLAALQRVPQVGALPDPQASMNFFLQPMELVGGNQIGSISVMQMFPWFGALKIARSEASLMAKARYQQFEADKADLFYRVKSSWYLLNKYNQEIKLVEENLSFLQSFEKLSLLKFQSPQSSAGSQSGGMNQNSGRGTGKSENGSTRMGGMNNSTSVTPNKKPMTPSSSAGGASMGSKQSGLSDVLRIRMEILDQQNRLALLQDQLKTEKVNFNALLNRNTEAEIQLGDTLKAEHLPLPVVAMADSIQKNNPMLSMIEAESQSYAAMAEKSRKMGLPMVGLGINYMFIQKQSMNSTSMMNGKDMIMPMINFSIPIYRKKYKAMKKEAELLQESAEQKSADLKNSLQVQYQQLIQDMEDANRRVKLNTEQADLARRTAGLLLTEYTSGVVDFEELIRMQYKVLDYKYQRIEAISDYNTAVTGAEKLMNSFTEKKEQNEARISK